MNDKTRMGNDSWPCFLPAANLSGMLLMIQSGDRLTNCMFGFTAWRCQFYRFPLDWLQGLWKVKYDFPLDGVRMEMTHSYFTAAAQRKGAAGERFPLVPDNKSPIWWLHFLPVPRLTLWNGFKEGLSRGDVQFISSLSSGPASVRILFPCDKGDRRIKMLRTAATAELQFKFVNLGGKLAINWQSTEKSYRGPWSFTITNFDPSRLNKITELANHDNDNVSLPPSISFIRRIIMITFPLNVVFETYSHGDVEQCCTWNITFRAPQKRHYDDFFFIAMKFLQSPSLPLLPLSPSLSHVLIRYDWRLLSST